MAQPVVPEGDRTLALPTALGESTVRKLADMHLVEVPRVPNVVSFLTDIVAFRRIRINTQISTSTLAYPRGK